MYEIEDGYIGGKRPHYVEVDDYDLENCETEKEKEDVIESAIQDHFDQNITFYWDKEQLNKKS